jgi:hypothetical protein
MKKWILFVLTAVLLSVMVNGALIYATRVSPEKLSSLAKEESLRVVKEELTAFQEAGRLTDEEKKEIAKYQRIVGIQVTIVPLQGDVPQKDETFALEPIFSQAYLYGKYVVVMVAAIFDLPPVLPDGRTYQTQLSVILFPNPQEENPDFQERLEEVAWSGEASGLPIMIFKRSNPIISVPEENLPVAPLAELREGEKLYQFNAIQNGWGTYPQASTLFVNQENGFFVFQGNLEFDNLEGALLFEKRDGQLRTVGLIVQRLGSLNGVAFSLEKVKEILEQLESE